MKIIDTCAALCYDEDMEKKYYKHKIENLLVIKHIVTIHYFEFDKDFKGPTESHDFWELVYAEKGSVLCTADGKEFELSEGEILFHKPDEVHSLRANGSTAPNVFIITFVSASEALHFFENRKLLLPKNCLRYIYAIIDEAKQTFDLPYSDPELKKMRLLQQPTLGGQQLIKNYLEILLIDLMRGESEKGNTGVVFLPEEQLGKRVAEEVLGYLTAHVDERLSVADICAALNYNKSYIFSEFKKATDRSVMSYFTHLKIKKAKALLRETSLSVTEISDSLSFDSPNYFSKVFKRTTGYTPLQYKKMRKR